MASKDRERGKAFERWVAGRLGWRRRRHGETWNGHDDNVLPDGSLAPVSIECKTYSVLQLQTAWIVQAKRNAGGRPWALVQRPKGWREPVVTIGWLFFEELLRKSQYITNHPEEGTNVRIRADQADEEPPSLCPDACLEDDLAPGVSGGVDPEPGGPDRV